MFVKNQERVKFEKWSMYCSQDSVVHWHDGLGIQLAGDQLSKRKVLGTDAEWLAKVGEPTSILVVLHCKLLSRKGLPASVFSSTLFSSSLR